MTDRALTTVTIDGAQYTANYEYTHQAVSEEFQSNLQSIVQTFNLQDVLDGGGLVTSSIADQIDGTLTGQVQTSIANLISLAQNGIVANVDPNDPSSPTQRYYLSVEMARDLDLLLNTFRAAGATNPASINESQLQLWRSIAAQTPSIQNIMQSVIETSGIANRSLQALTELIYIKTGNEVMADSLESLEEALTTTKGSLETLTDLQNLHNKLTATSKPTFSGLFDFDYAEVGDRSDEYADNYAEAYQALASVYFGTPVVPELESSLVQTVQAQVPSPLPSGYSGSTAAADYVKAIFGKDAVIESGYIFIKLPYDLSSGEHAADTYYNIDDYKPWKSLSFPPAVNQFPIFSAKAGDGFASALQDLLRLRERLRDHISELSALTPENNSGIDSEGTLVSRLKKVYEDINSHLQIPVERQSTNSAGSAVTVNSSRAVSFSDDPNSAFNGFRAWMLDNYDKKFGTSGADPAKSGLIQKNITFAITAGESLNDTQKEKVRRFLFVFEEYYKSASAVLTKLTQLIEKMAQSIGR